MSHRNIPTIHLLCMESKFLDAFNEALPTHWPTYNGNTNGNPPIKIQTHNSSLAALPATTKFDLVVSPANSYGRLDGAFDDAISRAFCLPHHDYDTLTRAAQKILYDKYRGFAPPGSCELVPFPDELVGMNEWGCKWVGLCPTMRTPDTARWDREVVYECVWSLLCSVERWNRGLDNREGEGSVVGEGGESRYRGRIESVLITPMATGCGGVSPKKWAAQFVLAMRHFVDALERPGRWSALGWREIYEDTNDVEKTWKM
ncbi:hypothetical protein BJX68DRAFT_230148 [Aspergillus pseudodeflectus]|uniref:Macro domain-like protein n=1 Tax=Aspergillus pseudodeflectus TaxID=176178 RepID=A0ABR4KVW4_9EURO